MKAAKTNDLILILYFFKGYRTSYVPLTRRGFRTPATPRRPQGSRFYVVKRKRNPNSISVNRRNQEEEDNEVDVEPATSSVNYQTTKSFHREDMRVFLKYIDIKLLCNWLC